MFIVKGDSALWTWGNGENYQLGFDSKASFSTPQLVPLSETVVVLHGCLNPLMKSFSDLCSVLWGRWHHDLDEARTPLCVRQ
jgi:hypothetical protein